MKNKTRVVSLLLVCMFLISATCSFASAASVQPTGQATVPEKMQPGSIIIYDDELQPEVVQGGYLKSSEHAATVTDFFQLRLASIPVTAAAEQAAQIRLENEIATEQYRAVMSGEVIQAEPIRIYAGMKVVYDAVTGDINNIYYPDPNEPSGYSIHNIPVESGTASKASVNQANGNVTWTWGSHNNTLTYRPSSDSFLGTGRATYFIGTYGNRNNRLQPYDCATKMAYDYSKVGDKNVQIRNLDTDEVFTYYQADVGSLPDAIIDIWGEDNIRELAGTPDGAPTDNANNVRYYHERFSDQTAPAR